MGTVHNMVLRICSGAFKTSPIESIYVDTEHMPLDLRSEELGLRYLMLIKSAPKIRSLQVVKDDKFPNISSLKVLKAVSSSAK